MKNDSYEAISKVIKDIESGNVKPLNADLNLLVASARLMRQDEVPIVDMTSIYEAWVVSGKPYHMYEDTDCAAPPFQEAIYGYQNRHGNVCIMQTFTWVRDDGFSVTDGMVFGSGHRWDVPDREIEWDRVKWITLIFGYFGGWSKTAGRSLRTQGIAFSAKLAIYEEGNVADVRWLQTCDRIGEELISDEVAVLLMSLNFLNCTNIAAVEPTFDRPARRRIARILPSAERRARVIHVFPAGRSRRKGDRGEPIVMPLSGVRAHFAHYGDCCPGRHEPRGKLFGKHTGKFYVPQHTRGSEEHGRIDHDYALRQVD